MEIWSDFQYDSLRKPVIKVFRAAYCSHDPGFCLLYKQPGPGFRLQSCLHLQDFQYFYFCLMKESWALKVAQQFGIWWLVAHKTVVYKNIKCKPKARYYERIWSWKRKRQRCFLFEMLLHSDILIFSNWRI